MIHHNYNSGIGVIDNMSIVSVVGMGYVGVPLAIAFDSEGYDVLGFDNNGQKIRDFQYNMDPTGEVGSKAIRQSEIAFTTDLADIESGDYYLITVPTPIDENGRPDLSYVEAAGETVGSVLSEGATVVLESTVYPGATRERLLPILERNSEKTVGEDFYLGYSPERINPANSNRGLRDIVKIVSGYDETARDRLSALYDDIIEAGVHVAPTMETAEAAKCLENTQRDVNIALMNEFAFGCHHVDLPMAAREVIEAASTKWNFHEYHPGSVGGHCIPVDPTYLIWKFGEHGFQSRLMETARAVNKAFADHVSRLTTTALAERMDMLEQRVGTDTNKKIADSDGTCTTRTNGGQNLAENGYEKPRLLVLGFAYKPHTTDIRSPVIETIVDQLRDTVDIVGVDPYASNEEIRSRFEIPVQDELSVANFDALLLTTSHERLRSLDLETVGSRMNDLPVLVDVTGTYYDEEAVENGFLYRGI